MSLTLSTFLSAFYPDENEPIWLFGFSPKEMPHDQKLSPLKKQITRKTLADNKLLQNNLIEENKRRGLYFTVNAGGTEKPDIKRINAVFCEMDDVPMADQHDLFDNCEYPPSIRVETKKSVHSYWLLSDTLTVEEFVEIQCGLIQKFHSDEKLKNQNRIMRLPFFKHVSWHGEFEYKGVTVHTFCPETRFRLSELREAFPFVKPPQPIYLPAEQTGEFQEMMTELRRRIMAHKTYKIERGSGWATCQGICHNGNGATAIAVNLASGYVHCQKGCTLDLIANAFGLMIPQKEMKRVNYIPRQRQESQTYRFLKDHVSRI